MRGRRGPSLVVGAGVVMCGLIACSHAATAPDGGALTVTITAPAGVAAQVVVTGPGGFERTVTATQTLTGLSTGSYVITAKNGTTTGPIVSTVEAGSVTGSPASVVTGQGASASVVYAPRPGSGALWVVGDIDTTTNIAYEFTPDQLQTSGAPVPAITLRIPHTPTKTGDVDAMAFDAAGNLWLGHYRLNTVTELSANTLAASGVVTEAVTISGPALMATQGLTFDARGNLWVSNNLPIGPGYTIVEYSDAQLAATGNPTPVATISGAALQGPEQMAFDAQGNLWVVNSLTSTLVEYTSVQLATGGALTPAITLGSDTAIGTGISPAFDRQGNLWLANVLQLTNGATVLSTIVEFPPSALAISGAPFPKQAITLPGNVPQPWQIAFDNSGDLWVATSSGHDILEYTAAQLTMGSNPSPAVTISLGALYPTGLAFDPHPPDLPLH